MLIFLVCNSLPSLCKFTPFTFINCSIRLLAFVLGLFLGGAYIGIYVKVRRKLALISKRSLFANQMKYKVVTEALYAIKDIKLLGREDYFINSFDQYAKQHAEDGAISHIIAHIPRYALETIAFGGVLVIILYLLFMQKNINDALPLLALYAFASLRLMPALQQIFTSFAFLRVSKDALNILTHDLKNEVTECQANTTAKIQSTQARLNFNHQLELKDIVFAYPNTHKNIVNGVHLNIKANTTVGFVGMTGAGKTTLVDIDFRLILKQRKEK